MDRHYSSSTRDSKAGKSATPEKDCVAIIPARAGSKRISEKNTRNFLGQPIIAYSIEAAKDTDLFRRVIVSTESDVIAAVARDLGAETPFVRPAELADDYATTADVLLHAIRWLITNDHMPTYFCCIYPAAPLISSQRLLEGHRKLSESDAPAVISVGRYPSPIWRALRHDEKDCLRRIWPEHEHRRTQDLQEAYFDAGQFYWCRTESFLAHANLLPPGSRSICLPPTSVLDIDTEDDWLLAECLARCRNAKDLRASPG